MAGGADRLLQEVDGRFGGGGRLVVDGRVRPWGVVVPAAADHLVLHVSNICSIADKVNNRNGFRPNLWTSEPRAATGVDEVRLAQLPAADVAHRHSRPERRFAHAAHL